jgi:hypothetical protein
MRAQLRQFTGVLVSLGVLGCQGSIESAPAPVVALAPEIPASNGWPVFQPTEVHQLRRLTNEQYAATVQTLLGISARGMPPIEPVSAVHGFGAIGASSGAVSAGGVAQFEAAARFLASAAFASGARQNLTPCTPTGPGDAACIEAFVVSFGRRAFRRPLSADEVTRYLELASQVATEAGDAWVGLEVAVTAFLQSPSFLYLPEIGVPDPQRQDRQRYSEYELASRLAYFLTNDMPDEALLGAAASGALSTAEGVQAQAQRLLALPSAHDAVRTFFTSLLSLDGLDALARDTVIFPKFTPTLGAAMREETLLGLEDLVFTRDGDFRELFNRPTTFINAELASLYGLPAPQGTGFHQVSLPAGRIGLLGQAGVLAVRDHGDGTAPTRRGLFVLTRLLCQELPLVPPANLPIPPVPTGVLTARQRLEEHAKNAVCAGCHSQTDPVGLSLEHFDALGAWRETDRGLAIDDSGKIGGTQYQGLGGLGALLRDHPALEPCLLQSLYDVGVGHVASEFDREAFSATLEKFQTGGARIRPALIAIATSDGFRYLPAQN